jgi:CRP-like cAMP-binding protein
MASSSVSPHDRLIRKLELVGRLSDDDRAALRQLPLNIKSYGPDREVVGDGEVPSHSCLLIQGLMHRYKVLPDGARQVLAYHIPGEIPDLMSVFIKVMDHSLGTVSACELAFIPHAALIHLMRDRPDVTAALWRETLVDSAIFREWIVNVGARPARPRIAHLFCELFERLTQVGLAEEHGFTLGLTQAEIGDATGLSAVHVNRSMQELRADGLIASEGKFLRILDWKRLQKTASYERRFLHMEEDAWSQR